jgi:hypothetical protein
MFDSNIGDAEARQISRRRFVNAGLRSMGGDQDGNLGIDLEPIAGRTGLIAE